MKRLMILSALLVGITAFSAEAQTTNSANRSKTTGQHKSNRRSPDSNPVADTAAMMSATDDGASGQSGRPVVNLAVPVTKGDSLKNKGRSRKTKQGSGSNK